jgi:hypothetical protein
MKPKTHAPVSTVVVTACPKPMRTPFCSPSGTATATGRGILLRHAAPFGGLVRAVGVSLPRACPKWTPLQIQPELRLWVSLAGPKSYWRAAAMDMRVGQCCNTANRSLQKTRNFNKALTIHKVKTIQGRQLALPKPTVNAR